MLFHVLDPEEIRPKLRNPVLMEDWKTWRQHDGGASRLHRAHEYRHKMDAHLQKNPNPRQA